MNRGILILFILVLAGYFAQVNDHSLDPMTSLVANIIDVMFVVAGSWKFLELINKTK